MLCYEKRNLFNIEYINFKLKYFGMLLNKMSFKSIFFFYRTKPPAAVVVFCFVNTFWLCFRVVIIIRGMNTTFLLVLHVLAKPPVICLL